MGGDVLRLAQRVRAVRWVLERPWAWSWLVALVFVALSGIDLMNIAADPDEGRYVLQARKVLHGEMPYVDFFYHQPPLYLYAAAPLSDFGASSLATVRIQSLVFVALGGVLLASTARTLVAPGAAIIAQVAFYSAPLQTYGLMALPNGSMVFFSLLGIHALLAREGRLWTAFAGVSLAAAVFVKPIAVPVVIAVLLALALDAETRRTRLPMLVLGGFLVTVVAGVSFELATDGGFTEILRALFSRLGEKHGYEAMMTMPEFRAMARQRGDTAFSWNAYEHWRVFVRGRGLLNGNLWLLLAGVVGLVLGRDLVPRRVLALLWLWLALPVCFSLWVWEPTWVHYLLQNLPPLTLGASLLFAKAMRMAAPERALAVSLVAVYAVMGRVYLPRDDGWVARVRNFVKQVGSQEYLSFSQHFYVVTDTTPACDFIDPMNVYGDHSTAKVLGNDTFASFHVTAEDLQLCLGSDTPVVVDRFAILMMDFDLAAYLLGAGDRVHYWSSVDKERLRQVIRSERPKLGASASERKEE